MLILWQAVASHCLFYKISNGWYKQYHKVYLGPLDPDGPQWTHNGPNGSITAPTALDGLLTAPKTLTFKVNHTLQNFIFLIILVNLM